MHPQTPVGTFNTRPLPVQPPSSSSSSNSQPSHSYSHSTSSVRTTASPYYSTRPSTAHKHTRSDEAVFAMPLPGSPPPSYRLSPIQMSSTTHDAIQSSSLSPSTSQHPVKLPSLQETFGDDLDHPMLAAPLHEPSLGRPEYNERLSPNYTYEEGYRHTGGSDTRYIPLPRVGGLSAISTPATMVSQSPALSNNPDLSSSDGGFESEDDDGVTRRPAKRPRLALFNSSAATLADVTQNHAKTFTASRPRGSSPATSKPRLGGRVSDRHHPHAPTRPFGSPLRLVTQALENVDDEEVDQLADDDDDRTAAAPTLLTLPTTLEPSPSLTGPSAPTGYFANSPDRRVQESPASSTHPLPRFNFDESRTVSSSSLGTHRHVVSLPSTPFNNVHASLPSLVPATSPSSSMSTSPALTTVSLDSPNPANPKQGPLREKKVPNYMHRANVPLYNRSKMPANPDEAFRCGYVPPRSTNPRAPQPSTNPCETTALKKADMERHWEEIHAKDEAERVMRGEIELGFAARYLVDIANIIHKEMKADPEGYITLDGYSIPTSVVRGQADRVRHDISKKALPETGYDFADCMDFKALAAKKLASYRVWVCECKKQFGSQRSMDRHKQNKHPNTVEVREGKRGKKRARASAGDERDANGSASPVVAGPSTSYHHTTASTPSPYMLPTLALASSDDTIDASRKRKRPQSPLKQAVPLAPAASVGASSSTSASPMMRVRQQTPELRVPEFGSDRFAGGRRTKGVRGAREYEEEDKMVS